MIDVVVRLSDEKWQSVLDGTWCGSEEIANGTPLPKGHGILIDADAVIAEAIAGMKYPANRPYMECVIAHMHLAQTIIEADK